MMEDVRFWFRPRNGTASTLASKVVTAGHRSVVVRDGLVGLIPFEQRADGFQWAMDMQDHFDAEFIESA